MSEESRKSWDDPGAANDDNDKGFSLARLFDNPAPNRSESAAYEVSARRLGIREGRAPDETPMIGISPILSGSTTFQIVRNARSPGGARNEARTVAQNEASFAESNNDPACPGCTITGRGKAGAQNEANLVAQNEASFAGFDDHPACPERAAVRRGGMAAQNEASFAGTDIDSDCPECTADRRGRDAARNEANRQAGRRGEVRRRGGDAASEQGQSITPIPPTMPGRAVVGGIGMDRDLAT